MNTLINHLPTSRFNRTIPAYSNDKLVVAAIDQLSKDKDVKDNAAAVDASKDINLSEIFYLNSELQKRFGYSNNEKLMIANEIIFKALINQSLKNGVLDLDDMDYINIGLKKSAAEYNKRLIKYYSQLVIDEKGISIKKDENDRITRLEGEKSKLEAEKASLIADKTSLEADKKNLEGDKAKLIEDKKNLEADKANLIVDKTNLEADKSKLVEEKKKLEAEKVQLLAEKKALEEEKWELLAGKKKLEEENGQLLEQIKKLEEEKGQLVGEKKKLEEEKGQLVGEKKKLEDEKKMLLEKMKHISDILHDTATDNAAKFRKLIKIVHGENNSGN